MPSESETGFTANRNPDSIIEYSRRKLSSSAALAECVGCGDASSVGRKSRTSCACVRQTETPPVDAIFSSLSLSFCLSLQRHYRSDELAEMPISTQRLY